MLNMSLSRRSQEYDLPIDTRPTGARTQIPNSFIKIKKKEKKTCDILVRTEKTRVLPPWTTINQRPAVTWEKEEVSKEKEQREMHRGI